MRVAWWSLGLAVVVGGCGIKQLEASIAASEAEVEALRSELFVVQTDNEVTTEAALWAERRLSAYRQLADELRAAFEDQGDLLISIRNGQMVVRMPTSIYFDRGEVELKEEGRDQLAKIAQTLKGVSDRRFLIAAHTDAEPISAKSKLYKTNLQLSALRAVAAFEHLAEEGLDPTKMAAAGYGEYLPIADDRTVEGRAENRRLEIIILPTPEELPELPETL